MSAYSVLFGLSPDGLQPLSIVGDAGSILKVFYQTRMIGQTDLQLSIASSAMRDLYVLRGTKAVSLTTCRRETGEKRHLIFRC